MIKQNRRPRTKSELRRGQQREDSSHGKPGASAAAVGQHRDPLDTGEEIDAASGGLWHWSSVKVAAMPKDKRDQYIAGSHDSAVR